MSDITPFRKSAKKQPDVPAASGVQKQGERTVAGASLEGLVLACLVFFACLSVSYRLEIAAYAFELAAFGVAANLAWLAFRV